MDLIPTLLGAFLGGGGVLIYYGIRRLLNKALDDAGRRKGFWPLNAGLVLAAASMYLMFQLKAG